MVPNLVYTPQSFEIILVFSQPLQYSRLHKVSFYLLTKYSHKKAIKTFQSIDVILMNFFALDVPSLISQNVVLCCYEQSVCLSVGSSDFWISSRLKIEH